jgi:hypothetical protein
MKKLFIILAFLLTNCSSNSDQKIRSNVNIKKIEIQNDIISMSFKEYKIFIEEYAKKSKYPDIK